MKPGEMTILIFIATLLSLALFATIITILVFLIRTPIRKYKPFDLAIFDRLHPWTSPYKTRVMLFFTFLGTHQFLIPANLLLIFYFLVATHQNWFSIRVLTIALSSLVLMFLLKYLFQRKRPLSPLLKAAKGLSFPSGHAIMAVTFYGLLLYILWHSINADWLKYIMAGTLVVIIILIGFSRINPRVHYPSVVLAGFIIGLFWLLIYMPVMNGLEDYAKRGKAANADIVPFLPYEKTS